MTATIVAQQAINGIVLGSLYVLVALGLTLIYGVLVQINFAHADFVTLGAFSAYFFMHVLGGSYLASIGVALVVGGVLGWLINVAIFAPLRRKGNELLPLIATIGVSMMLQNAMLGLFGPMPYAFETPYSQQVFRFAGTFFTLQSVHHHRGLDRDDRAALRLHEVHLPRQGAARGVAGSRDRRADGHQSQSAHHAHLRASPRRSPAWAARCSAPVLVLTPFAGTSVIVKAFAIVIIGGFGNVEGTILAGLLVGLIESFTTQYLDPGPDRHRGVRRCCC